MNFKDYWSTKKSSGQRNTEDLITLKAKEHNLIISGINILDIGCGAGELLSELINLEIPIKNAIDFSDSMINESKNKINNEHLLIETADTFTFLNDACNDTWICTQSINQYLDEKDLKKIITIFEKNTKVKKFIMFDTIDPIKYYLWKHGIINNGGNITFARKTFGLLKSSILTLTNTKTAKIGEMGYAYSTIFFFCIAKEMKLKIKIYNSIFYEYRYHVEIQKADEN